MKKKIIGVFTMLATFLLLLVTSQQVFAQNAVISGKVKIWSNALARQFRTGILDGQTGSNPVGNSLTGYSDVRVFLLDGNYNILAETFSGGHKESLRLQMYLMEHITLQLQEKQ